MVSLLHWCAQICIYWRVLQSSVDLEILTKNWNEWRGLNFQLSPHPWTSRFLPCMNHLLHPTFPLLLQFARFLSSCPVEGQGGELILMLSLSCNSIFCLLLSNDSSISSSLAFAVFVSMNMRHQFQWWSVLVLVLCTVDKDSVSQQGISSSNILPPHPPTHHKLFSYTAAVIYIYITSSCI